MPPTTGLGCFVLFYLVFIKCAFARYFDLFKMVLFYHMGKCDVYCSDEVDGGIRQI